MAQSLRHRLPLLGSTLVCMFVVDLNDWAFLLSHLARWMGRAGTAALDDYACFPSRLHLV